MDFIIATIAALILSVAVSLIDKWILTRLPPRTILIIIGAYGFLTLAFLPATGSVLPQGGVLVAGLAIGAIFAALIYCSFRAIEVGELSRLAPLGVLSTVLVIIGGIVFFDEPLTTHRLIAFLFFVIGSILLATRFERQLLIFEPETYVGAFKTAHHHVKRTLREPFAHTMRMSRYISRRVGKMLLAMGESKLLVVRSRVRPKLIRGFWWNTIAIALSVTVAISMKWLTVKAGAIPAFVSMRLGMACAILIGFLLSRISIREAFGKHPHAARVAAIKEPFGIAIGFLLAYAYAHGDLGTIRSILSLDSVLILTATILLTRAGILHESLARKDILQKMAGVACMVTGMLLLFL